MIGTKVYKCTEADPYKVFNLEVNGANNVEYAIGFGKQPKVIMDGFTSTLTLLEASGHTGLLGVVGGSAAIGLVFNVIEEKADYNKADAHKCKVKTNTGIEISRPFSSDFKFDTKDVTVKATKHRLYFETDKDDVSIVFSAPDYNSVAENNQFLLYRSDVRTQKVLSYAIFECDENS